jgi:agmatine deiminase
MAWPARSEIWAEPEKTRQTYADVAHAIRRFEPLTMLVPPQLVTEARNYLGSDIDIFEVPVNDSWTRDSGPNYVVSEQKIAGVCFTFNAWGEKYQPYDQDAKMARRILERDGIKAIESQLVAEGGGLCVDGEGTLLTTSTCFPNANRNPGWTREDIEAELQATLGATKVIWLPGDPLDNETDGHIDGIAAFSEPGKIIIEASNTPGDSRKPFFDSLRRQLEQETDAAGRHFELLELPEAPQSCAIGERFCLSYVNFYIANGAVIAPAYGVSMDDLVKERLQSYFPAREIVQVPITYIAEGGGGIHCITQQQPRV